MLPPPPIYDAAVYGDRERVEVLLLKQPDLVNATDEFGFTPLHGIVQEDHFALAEYLIEHGARVMARNDAGVTPLHLAAYPEMVRILFRHGADLEAKEDGGGTPLHLASENPEALEVMRELLKLGADPNAIDNSGGTVLATALEREESDKVELLLSYGARHAGA
jgi:ankyrin repeat protein